MKKLLIATTASALIAGAASAEDIKLGIVFGFTGPIESLTQPMAQAAEMAMKEVSDSGALLGGATVEGIRGDSTCIDSAAAVAATERLVTSDKVNGIVGGDCSGVTGAMLQNVARPNGIVMIRHQRHLQLFQLLKTMVYFSEHHLLMLVKVKL